MIRKTSVLVQHLMEALLALKCRVTRVKTAYTLRTAGRSSRSSHTRFLSAGPARAVSATLVWLSILRLRDNTDAGRSLARVSEAKSLAIRISNISELPRRQRDRPARPGPAESAAGTQVAAIYRTVRASAADSGRRKIGLKPRSRPVTV